MPAKTKTRPAGHGGNAVQVIQEEPNTSYRHDGRLGQNPQQAAALTNFWQRRQQLVLAFKVLIDLGIPREDLIEEADGTGSQLRHLAVLSQYERRV